MIAWFMIGLLLAAETTCENETRIRDEMMKLKDGSKEASTANELEEDVYRLTCYTCVNVSDNQMCNEWAIDTPCPPYERDFCRSLHILDSRGKSVLVKKSCASSDECGPATVGCILIDMQKICISCCDLSYCNVDSPTNATNAAFSKKRRGKAKSAKKGAVKNGVDVPRLDYIFWSSAFVLLPRACRYSSCGHC